MPIRPCIAIASQTLLEASNENSSNQKKDSVHFIGCNIPERAPAYNGNAD